MTTALTEGSEAELPGYTDEAINVATQLLAHVDTVPELWTTRGYNRMLRYARLNHLDDVNGTVTDFKQAVAHTAADDAQILVRSLNVAWASEARFDRLKAVGEEYRVIEVDGVERWRGPRDLVLPIWMIEALLGRRQRSPACTCGRVAEAEAQPGQPAHQVRPPCRAALAAGTGQRHPTSGRACCRKAWSRQSQREVAFTMHEHAVAGSLVATVEQGQGRRTPGPTMTDPGGGVDPGTAPPGTREVVAGENPLRLSLRRQPPSSSTGPRC